MKKTLEFKEMLERRTGLTVELWDERLTTVAADNLMMEAGIRRENRKEYVDQIAASFILQGYLDYLQNEKESGVNMEKVNFTDPDTNESAEFYVLEQTTIRGNQLPSCHSRRRG